MSDEVEIAEEPFDAKRALAPLLGKVDLSDPASTSIAYDDLQEFKKLLREVEGHLKDALLDHARVLGKKTGFVLDGVAKVEIKSNDETVYNVAALRHDLRAAGMPEERIKEIVRETIDYKVMAREATSAGKANEEYAKIFEQNRTVVAKTPTVTVKRVGGAGGTSSHVKRPAGRVEMTTEALPAPADAEESDPW